MARPARVLHGRRLGLWLARGFAGSVVSSASHFTVSEVSAHDIVETARDALLVLDDRLTVVSANRAFFAMFTTNAAQTIGRRLYDLGDRQWNIPALRRLLEEIIPRQHTVEGYEIEHDFEGVGLRTMLLNARRVHRPGGAGFVLLAIDDVTDLRRKEREAARHERLALTIVDTARDPLVILDEAMRIVDASRNFRLMFAGGVDDVAGLRLEDLMEGQWDVAALRARLDRVVPDERPFDDFLIEDDFPGLGRRIFKLNARKLSAPGNGVRQLLLVFEDATRATLFDRHRDILAVELAHRIKNSLQVISSFVSFELRRAAEPCLEGFRAMQARIGAVAELYDVIARSSAFGPVDAPAYLEGIASSIRASLIGAHSRIRIVVDAEPCRILADQAVPFGLIVNELATNAIKYAFPRGEGHIVLGFRRRDGEVALTVADDGAGMGHTGGGDGMGSRFIDAFARQLGGKLAKASADTGTTFIVRLPLTILDSAGDAGPAPS
jgi:PAS domain S-box-containing protein